MTPPKTFSPADWWRPSGRGPVCGVTFRDSGPCEQSGPHFCVPRADRVVAFFAELLRHTKGPHARKPFVLEPWQANDIVRPLFGEVVWSDDWSQYVRRYRVAFICLARKNGKSELLAGITLYLLVGDDEESAEVYGAAKDTKQAGKVFEPALRMMQLSPLLSKRLMHNKNARRLIDEKSASYLEIISADALGELGHNPHGFYLDEVLSQRDDSLWNTLRTAAGARTQPLFVCATTETNDSASFGASMIDEAERVQEDPSRNPHMFAYVRKTPPDADPWDEANWKLANPALGSFLSLDALRQEALEARNEPQRENSFRQYRLNQRVQQATRYLPLDLWDDNIGEVAANPGWMDEKLAGTRCHAGLDLSSKLDLTAWSLLFEDGTVRWRFWCPESVVTLLDEHTGGQFSLWVAQGWVSVTDGDVIDYQTVYREIEQDHSQFVIADVTYDKWSGEPVRQELEDRTGLTMVESDTTYQRMTGPMSELMRLLKSRELRHGGNPVARWMADNLEAKSPKDDPDRIRPVKPDRQRSGKRIDGMPALLFAIDGRMRVAEPVKVPGIAII